MMAATFRNKSSIITEHHGWRARLSNAWAAHQSEVGSMSTWSFAVTDDWRMSAIGSHHRAIGLHGCQGWRFSSSRTTLSGHRCGRWCYGLHGPCRRVRRISLNAASARRRAPAWSTIGRG